MFENAVTLWLVPGNQQKVIRLLRRFILPVLKTQPGLISLGLVPHPDGNQITILSEWKEQSFAIAAETTPGYYLALRKLEPFLEEIPAAYPTERN